MRNPKLISLLLFAIFDLHSRIEIDTALADEPHEPEEIGSLAKLDPVSILILPRVAG